MIRPYVKFAQKAFQKNMVYRANLITGIISTLISVFATVAIWRAIYGNKSIIDGISFKVLVTNFILGLALTTAFSINEYQGAQKVWSGAIANDLLKPISYMGYVFFENLGQIFFNLVMILAPVLIISGMIIGILPPYSLVMFILFLLSALLGYLILFIMSFMVSISAFWIYDIFSISTLKSVVISILSGVILPLWFMPEWLQHLIRFTPFDSIYFIPLSIYLGKIEPDRIIFSFWKQLIWVIVLFVLGYLLWRKARKKLVIEGG